MIAAQDLCAPLLVSLRWSFLGRADFRGLYSESRGECRDQLFRHLCAKVRKRHARVPCTYNIPMGSFTGQVLPSKCVPFILLVGTTRGSRPRWITIGAGPRLECLPPEWVMIGAGPRLGIGLGLRLGLDRLIYQRLSLSPSPIPRRGPTLIMTHPGRC